MSIFNQRYLLKVVSGIVIGVAFIVSGLSLTGTSTSTARWLAQFNLPIQFLQIWFVVSGVINVVIGLTNSKFNYLWIACWVLYATIALVAKVQGSTAPILPIIMYQVLSILLLKEVWLDNRQNGGIWRT